MAYQIAALLILALFYGIYAGKLLLQRKRGIRTDQMAKGRKDRRLLRTEAAMTGLCLAGAGVVVFGTAVHTMRDSWRAGIPEKDRTELITTGIFRVSRNPAFVGFDLLYIGILTAFFNWALLFFTLFAVTMLHLQILQEEKFLPTVFGSSYLAYRRKVRRYL